MSANDQGTEWLPTLELILGAASAGANQKAADYEQANVEFSAEISVIEQELRAINSKRGDAGRLHSVR
jgi:hypothetical protein